MSTTEGISTISSGRSEDHEYHPPHYRDIFMATAIPSQHEIVLPVSELSVDEDQDPFDEEPQYANIRVHRSPDTTPFSSPKSVARWGEFSGHHPGKPMSPNTRQSTFDIGEEWERFQTHRKSKSCPSTPKAERSSRFHENIRQTQSPSPEVSPNSETLSTTTKEPLAMQFFFPVANVTVKHDHHIIPNPYNKINHRFHSTLHCPCFLFFFFLCCLPGVYFMQQSDIHFRKGDKLNARKRGIQATVFYILGSLVGVAFLTVSIFFTAQYVRQYASD